MNIIIIKFSGKRKVFESKSQKELKTMFYEQILELWDGVLFKHW